MRSHSGKIFFAAIVMLVLSASPVFSRGHHSLNGTWKLIPARGEYGGEAVVQTGTVSINDRENNIYISRSYKYEGANQTHTSSFSTDGRENSTIRNGKTFKSKAKWEGDTLVVTTLEDNESAVERYNLEPDGTLRLTIERSGQAPATLFFQRAP
jgi:hypothetical protein